MAMRATFALKEVDKGWKQLRQGLENLAERGSYVKAGLTGPKAEKKEHKGDALSNLTLGLIHEFGAPAANIPARPFILPAFRKNREEYLKLLRRFLPLAYEGKIEWQRVLGLIGAKMAADMKDYVTGGPQIPPPNQGYPDHGYWMEKLERGQGWQDKRRASRKSKGLEVQEGPLPPPRTLVDTGRMIGSITWAVVKKDARHK
jgi:hypothetical protein